MIIQKVRIPGLILAAASALLLFSCNGQRQKKNNTDAEMTGLLQTKLDSLTDNLVVPGVTLSVRFGDGTNISLASGLADVENEIPMKPDDIMLSGSVGKTYVAAVILKLYEQGLIDLKQKAISYLQDEDWFLKIPNSPDITVEMLLNHTAGIPEYVYHKELWQAISKDRDKEWSVAERLSFISNDPPTNPPGEGWAYADSHYLVLGSVIEKVTGRSYYEVLDELIIGPCKLSHTFHSDRRTIPGLIPGYTNLTDEFLLPHKVLNDNMYAFNPQMEWTGGGLASSVSDLTLWVSRLYGGSVLKPETLKLMLTPAPYKTTLFENAGYGLGSFIAETDGITYYGHTGFSPGYITYVQYLPDNRIALALQVNDDSSHDNFSLKEYFNTIKKVVMSHSLPAAGNAGRSLPNLQKRNKHQLKLNNMEKDVVKETIIALETAALRAWLDGNPSPYLELYSKDFTYFDPVQERRIDGWDRIKEFYESMRGTVKMDGFEIINPVVQHSGSMAVLTYNLQTNSGETVWKENCTEVYRLEENNEWKIIHSHWSLTGPSIQ